MTTAMTTAQARPGRTVLSGARVVTPSGVLDGGRVTVEGRRITAVTAAGAAGAAGAPEPGGTASGGTASGGAGADGALDLTGHWLVPGFVDLHNHGGGGASFTSGTAEDVLTGVRTHRAHGTTTLVASTVTGDLDVLARQAALLAELVQQGDLAGVHFEGPFISPCRKGAHSEELLRDPDPAEVRKLVDAAHGTAVMCTLATERPGGIDSVRLLADHGVIAAVGHTDATYEQTREAVDAGATVATHLFNAMPGLGHRAPGPIAALLEDERVTVELINDGTHLHPAALQLAFARAGGDRVAFITDAMDAAGFGDGRYQLGPMEVDVVDGVARLARDGAIAGSTLTLDTALRRAVTVDGLAVEDAVRAVSATPARLLGLADRVGAIAPGLDADLVVLDGDWTVRGVLRRGGWIVEPAPSAR
ncbi:N-acetylglucosamine-6-phosphate deacetylase [Streptomyces sp. TRM 70351]|uniref:N-acetylglucosamine-6-phosphate deacetylase n=1 Tax=Streptomyces sp. TRM 70351 TaxID=3116552 RepID=UPI002E7C1A22|nr:N-acetylglucosamine-6-phosphate deacetylase [Streptomyces sp. TRM 70351]MEE1929669.1 N-acetylglucosamine-6-phosphate deacetylase [Streptomyces sp. TRM 70351]